MSRPHGSKNRRTIIREAEARAGKLRDPSEIFDSLYMIEVAASWFFRRAELGRDIKGQERAQVDADYEKAAHLAALAVPFRHARLSATKVLGDPNHPVRFRDDASADELRAEIMKRIAILTSSGLIDLEALPTPDHEGGIANRPMPEDGTDAN